MTNITGKDSMIFQAPNSKVYGDAVFYLTGISSKVIPDGDTTYYILSKEKLMVVKTKNVERTVELSDLVDNETMDSILKVLRAGIGSPEKSPSKQI